MNHKLQSFLRAIHPRFLAMDIGRLVCFSSVFIIRLKKYHVSGKPYNARLKGGAIISANHTSFLDPFVINTIFRYRRHFWLAAEVLMSNKIGRPFLKGMGCIEIDRHHTDLNAIKKCIKVLKSGRVLTVFPQGGISNEGEVENLKSGAVLMALQANVPILPIYFEKTGKRWFNYRAVIGDAIDCNALCPKKMPSLSDMQMLTDTLQVKINECKEVCERLGN